MAAITGYGSPRIISICLTWKTRKPMRLSWNEIRARAAHPDATLADLYDPDLMPPNLRRAHQAIDRTMDRLYRAKGFASERERVEHLFMLYEKSARRWEP